MKNKLIMLGFCIFIILGLVGCNEIQTQPTSAPKNIADGNLKVYYLDVGQGDSILIQTDKGKNVLIDGGNNNKGELVVQYLNALNIKTLDAVIGTHPDADHIGGLDTVLENLDVKAVYIPKVTHTTITYEEFILAVKEEGLKLKEAKAGVTLELDGMDATFVGPVKDYDSDLNTWSAVLKVTHGNNSFLFTGDATIKSEEDMMSTGHDLKADVLKLGHHGANTSTGDEFLSKVNPTYAIVSAGADNQYGHPTTEILQKLKEKNVKVYRTDELGTILATSNGKSISFDHIESLAEHSPVKAANSAPVKSGDQTNAQQSDSKAKLRASVDNPKPSANSEIHLNVTGWTGAKYQAILHYKSKDTMYEGRVGTPLPIKIGRAAAGTQVDIEVTVTKNGETYKTQTSFTPQ